MSMMRKILEQKGSLGESTEIKRDCSHIMTILQGKKLYDDMDLENRMLPGEQGPFWKHHI